MDDLVLTHYMHGDEGEPNDRDQGCSEKSPHLLGIIGAFFLVFAAILDIGIIGTETMSYFTKGASTSLLGDPTLCVGLFFTMFLIAIAYASADLVPRPSYQSVGICIGVAAYTSSFAGTLEAARDYGFMWSYCMTVGFRLILTWIQAVKDDGAEDQVKEYLEQMVSNLIIFLIEVEPGRPKASRIQPVNILDNTTD